MILICWANNNHSHLERNGRRSRKGVRASAVSADMTPRASTFQGCNLRREASMSRAFGMADAVSLQACVNDLEMRGATPIGVVRLFVSGDSFLDAPADLRRARRRARASVPAITARPLPISARRPHDGPSFRRSRLRAYARKLHMLKC
jgi:hypothetical protein